MSGVPRASALLVIGSLLALVVGCGSDDAGTADASAPGTTTPSPTASSPASPASSDGTGSPATPTEDEFCAAFVRFAGAQSQYEGEQDAATVEELVTSALVLATMPQAEGMTPGTHASLVALANGTIDTLVPPSDLPTAEAAPDDAAFAAYLQDACPA